MYSALWRGDKQMGFDNAKASCAEWPFCSLEFFFIPRNHPLEATQFLYWIIPVHAAWHTCLPCLYPNLCKKATLGNILFTFVAFLTGQHHYVVLTENPRPLMSERKTSILWSCYIRQPRVCCSFQHLNTELQIKKQMQMNTLRYGNKSERLRVRSPLTSDYTNVMSQKT